MRLLIDTSVDSGFGVPASAESLWAERWLRRVGPLPVSAVSVFERSYGFRRAMARSHPSDLWRERLAAYEEAVLEGGFYEVLAWDAGAALLAGLLFEKAPFPPPGFVRRTRTERKTDARRSWLLDVLIASQSAADGRAVLTRNHQDFQLISTLLVPPFQLQVLRFPEDAEDAFAP